MMMNKIILLCAAQLQIQPIVDCITVQAQRVVDSTSPQTHIGNYSSDIRRRHRNESKKSKAVSVVPTVSIDIIP